MVGKTNFSRTVSVLVIRELKESGGPRNVGLLTIQMSDAAAAREYFTEFSLRGSFKLCHLPKLLLELIFFQERDTTMGLFIKCYGFIST